MSVNAYRQAKSMTERPRAMEQRLMTEVTNELIIARKSSLLGSKLMPALHRNREVWSTLSAVCGAPGNQLPPALRASVISLSLWVDRFTSEIVAGRESIDPLIDVNIAIIEGLAPAASASAVSE